MPKKPADKPAPPKPAPKAAPQPEREAYAYNWRSRNNLKRGKDC